MQLITYNIHLFSCFVKPFIIFFHPQKYGLLIKKPHKIVIKSDYFPTNTANGIRIRTDKDSVQTPPAL